MEQSSGLKPKIVCLIKSLILSYALTALILLVLSFLLYKFHLSEQVVNIAILAIYVFSSFIGGFYTGKKTGNRKFLWGFLSGVLYFMLLLVISAILNKSGIAYSEQLVIALAMCVVGGTIGGMLS